MDDNTQVTSNVLSRLSSLQKRTKEKINRPVFQSRNITPQEFREESPVVNQEPVYEPAEVSTEAIAQRVTDDEQFKKAQTMAEQVIPASPIQLKGKTEFVPEKMYEQVRNDYIGFIRQAINSALDKLTLFYMQGNRFKESKDMRVFLMKSLQEDIHELKKQYVLKYPLISGLNNMLSLVEQQESLAFKSMVDEFLNRMIGNTFTS